MNARIRILIAILLGTAGLSAAQTTAAQSSAAPVVFVYAPGFGIVGAVLDPSIAVTCTTQGICTVKATAPAQLSAVSCESYTLTAAQTVFPLKFTPASGATFAAYKNGLLLMNAAGKDYALAGATVTMTAAQAGATSDTYCFSYSY